MIYFSCRAGDKIYCNSARKVGNNTKRRK